MAFRKKFENDMKVPVRPAPLPPAGGKSLYSPVTNWEDNLFEADVFEPTPNTQRKKPPPRPPPPLISAKPDVATLKPSHFIRKPTILGALLTRKSKNESNYSATQTQQTDNISQMVSGKSVSSSSSFSSQSKLFSSTASKSTTSNTKSSAVLVASLIDLSSPPESPTFTTRSSSDGLSVDSFGSDATSSTNNHFANGGNGGNTSQAESGFEDDFDLFSSNRIDTKDDSTDGWVNFDPFSPAPLPKKTTKKTAITNGEYLDPLCNGKTILPAVQTHKVPTIIRAKPTRPKPPENSSLLKSGFTSVTAPSIIMNLNMANPIQKTNCGISDYSSSSRYSDLLSLDLSEKRDSSPPMPTIPPPPPPILEEDLDCLESWPSVEDPAPTSAPDTYTSERIDVMETEPYGYSLYAYHGDHDDDLNFDENVKVKLLRKIDDEWMFGRLKNGAEGMFPANYVDVKIPLPETTEKHSKNTTANTEKYHNRKAKALYNFVAEQPGDLPLTVGCDVTILNEVNGEWLYGERNGQKGQFPANYVQIC